MRYVFVATVAVWLAAELALRIPRRRESGATVSREWRSLAVIWGAALVGGILAGQLVRYAPALDLSPLRHWPALAVALVLIWSGIGLRLWAIATLGRYFRPIVHLQEGHRVVRNGPYRVLRHPAYSGLLLALCGFSLPFANLASIVVYNACVLAGVLYRIRVEERVLIAGLGDEYADYMRDTRRLVPGLW